MKDIFYNKVFQKRLFKDLRKEEKEYKYLKDSTYLEFKRNLKKLGFKFKVQKQILDYCESNPISFKNLILDYYNKSTRIDDKEFYIQCLINKQNKDLFPFFLQEAKTYFISNQTDTWFLRDMINNCFLATKDLKFKEFYLDILNTNEYGQNRWGIVELCGSLKIKEAIPYLKQLLNEVNGLHGYILNALTKYENVEDFRDIFEYYCLSKDSYLRAIAKKGMKKIIKKLEQKQK